ncbi:MAG: DUF1127 domain-containing protein [Candidatus Competibacteraceae bacterium]
MNQAILTQPTTLLTEIVTTAGALAASLRRGWRRLRGWRRAAYERRLLRELPENRLRDIGLSRTAIERATAGFFWQPIDYAWLEQQRQNYSRRHGGRP